MANKPQAKGLREAWLMQAVDLLRPVIEEVRPCRMKVKVSVGFPYRRKGKGSHAVGQCWCSTRSKANVFEIFVCPTQDQAITVLAILLHELIHATVGLKEGHKGDFRTVAKSVGLEGKMTATVPGVELTKRLNGLAKSLGAYPHRELDPTSTGSGAKKEGTRLLKVWCPDCEYTCRITMKWIEIGLPTCVCGTEMTTEG